VIQKNPINLKGILKKKSNKKYREWIKEEIQQSAVDPNKIRVIILGKNHHLENKALPKTMNFLDKLSQTYACKINRIALIPKINNRIKFLGGYSFPFSWSCLFGSVKNLLLRANEEKEGKEPSKIVGVAFYFLALFKNADFFQQNLFDTIWEIPFKHEDPELLQKLPKTLSDCTETLALMLIARLAVREHDHLDADDVHIFEEAQNFLNELNKIQFTHRYPLEQDLLSSLMNVFHSFGIFDENELRKIKKVGRERYSSFIFKEYMESLV
jgi:hypothetical protein